ncbi:hypothetical protein FG93_05291 [Bosea sp. LC85]|nr:hypothetical protein FG93_05291 [Bosea sp. LC85]
MNKGQHELRVAFKRIEREVPKGLASTLRWLRHPASRWARIPVGLLLILGGVFSLLPVLGLWMLPLGLLLISADIAPLRKPMARFVHASMNLWGRLQRWWHRRN